jgi:L-2-amino-thiazoline-4-carboxylic acid hydrolase
MGENESVGLLQQRRIEARVFKAFLTVLELEFGAEKARSLVASVVRDLAFQKGREYRKLYPKGNIGALANFWQSFAEGGALDIEFIEQTESCLSFRIKRCGYAEAYREMGLADLGCLLSCDRDEPFLKGFSDEIALDRSRTIIEGGRYCDFVYRAKK